VLAHAVLDVLWCVVMCYAVSILCGAPSVLCDAFPALQDAGNVQSDAIAGMYNAV
jgi:hypothetical protein